jgi:methylthioribulose 1-phosphate dehydratase/enolase-phosphatase E1
MNGTTTALDAIMEKEHNSSSIVQYDIAQGRVFLDLRDIGDSWLRCTLYAGMKVSLPAGLYRRFVIDKTAQIPVEFFHVNNNNSQLSPRYPKASDALEIVGYHNYRELICQLCRQFFDAGWVTGTGGSISIRYGNRIYMTPSGVQKERIQPDELYALDLDGNFLSTPEQKPGGRVPKLSDCSPLFLHAYRLRNAGAVLHSHGMCCNLVTALFDGQKEFRITHQEMIKGLAGYGYKDELVIPIIENTSFESQLAHSLSEAIQTYPKASAVLVRRHGIYVWGSTWEAAKRHSECLHYLFECALNMHKYGFNFRVPPQEATTYTESACKRMRTEEKVSFAEAHKYILLDIEGTTTPITFVKDVLFPFALNNVESFLKNTWDTQATQVDVAALRLQSVKDQKSHPEASKIMPATSSRDNLIASIVDYVAWNIAADRKVTALKQLQGHIWEFGYQSGELKSKVYDDVPKFMQRMQQKKVKVGIYSSGSREAQRSLFKYTNHGDLREYLSCYFDTKVGHKRESNSYKEILQYLGVDSAKDVLFITDVIQEAEAAAEIGIDVALSVRPGNAAIPVQHHFRMIHSFDDI